VRLLRQLSDGDRERHGALEGPGDLGGVDEPQRALEVDDLEAVEDVLGVVVLDPPHLADLLAGAVVDRGAALDRRVVDRCSVVVAHQPESIGRGVPGLSSARR
jgi:hypothetical protein